MKNRRTKMNDTGIGSIIEVQGMRIQAVKKYGLLQRQSFPGTNRVELSGFRHGKLHVIIYFSFWKAAPAEHTAR